MKLFRSVFLCMASSIGLCHSATISVTNLSGAEFTSILNSSGTSALTSGFVVIGTFNIVPTVVSDIFLPGNFTQAGNSVPFFGPTAPGYFTGTVNTGTLTNGDAFVGKTLYAIFANGTTLANSTGLAVWKAVTNAAGNVFTEDNPTGGPNTVTVLDSKGQLVIGTRNPSFNTPGFGTAPAFQLAPVPEPSTLLLSTLGCLALLRRRR